MSAKAITWAHDAMLGTTLPTIERLCLLNLAFHHNPHTNECFPSLKTLADECAVSTRRIQDAIARLVDCDLIKKTRGGTSAAPASNRYALFGIPKQSTKILVRRLAPSVKNLLQTGKPARSGVRAKRNTASDLNQNKKADLDRNTASDSNRNTAANDRGTTFGSDKRQVSGPLRAGQKAGVSVAVDG